MNVLMIGDVVGKSGCDFLMKHLTSVKRFYSCDICIVNGENSAPGNGITKDSLEMILSSGADAVTTGNHVYKRDNFYQCLESERYPVARPANYPERAPGRGYIILDKGRYKAAVINMMGTSMMQPLDNPFDVSDRIIQKLKDVKFKIMDFHAEATGEKKAIAYYLDGKVSVIAGTHTHVQRADSSERHGIHHRFRYDGARKFRSGSHSARRNKNAEIPRSGKIFKSAGFLLYVRMRIHIGRQYRKMP